MTKRVYAPAKINLCLHVLERRDDGYHELATLMQHVSLFDRLDVSLAPGSDIIVSCPQLRLPQGIENLAVRAARLFLRQVGEGRSVAIKIDKHIPEAAGLGGGSSDAAAVLMALNEMLGCGLSRSELMGLGRQLGADVPFFIYGRTAWATGVGERLQPWPGLPPVWLVLVNPRVAVSTAWAFQNLGLTHPRSIAKLPKFPQGMSSLVCLLQNDLEAVTCQRHPVITTIKERLVAGGAAGALMSGSGPTVFGVFENRSRAERVAAALSLETAWWVAVASPL